MIAGSLRSAATTMHARLLGEDAGFSGVSTDSRTLRGGELFFALQGPQFDGHAYIASALDAGASGAVAARTSEHRPLLVTADTRKALGLLAAGWRIECAPRVVAVTGSNGKTTVKEMLAQILSDVAPALATEGNLNNDVGVPLTLFRLTAGERFAVVELGANHAGEIAWLTRIARPDVAVITNAGPSHLEGFGSVLGVAHAKGEIFQGLGASGCAVINADDRHISVWRALASPFRVITFGLGDDADVRASIRDGTLRLATSTHEAATPIELQGQHNARNAAAAAAAALAFDVPLEAITVSLGRMRPVKGRLQFKPALDGAQLIDDSYNANPASLAAAVDVLMTQPQAHKYVLLGDMAELGGDALQLHRQAGEQMRVAGVERLYAVGDSAAAAAQAFGQGGASFADCETAAQALLPVLSGDVCLLIKGSRSMRMEHAVELLTKSAGGEH